MVGGKLFFSLLCIMAFYKITNGGVSVYIAVQTA